jgi:hypothetical protein
MQLVTAVPLPHHLIGSRLSFLHIMGELMTILRPLISIICIRIFGVITYKSYLISLGIDLLVMVVLQRGMGVGSEEERKEMRRRKMEMAMRYLFRKPFFLLVKGLVIEPLLAKIIKP